ncbi:MAG TPA: Gfo/Idh/MocA family oxidoreductase [Chloroflexota bacterium]|nr:Gfo/Idh/MocA family oxidoreductase [Chloroflexota bacterium]
MSERGQAGTEAGQAGVSGAPGQQGEGAISWPRYRGTYRAAVVGHTGRGNYGHGLDLAFAGLPGVEVVAVADPDAAGRAGALARTGAPRGYAAYGELLEREAPDLLAVGPRQPDQREAMLLAAMRAGVKAIYTEKPFARTLEEADRILAEAEERGVRIAVAHQNRAFPGPRLARRLLAEGRIGRLRALKAYGKQDRRGGGQDLMVLGTHMLDLMRFFCGDARWCHARVVDGGAEATPDAVREGEEAVGPVAGDDIWAGYGFDGGVSGSYESARAADGGSGSDYFRLELCGTGGTISIWSSATAPLYYCPRSFALPNHPEEWEALPTDAVQGELIAAGGLSAPPTGAGAMHAANQLLVVDLLAALEAGREPLSSGHDARAALEMIMAVYWSHLRAQRVPLPLAERAHPLLHWQTRAGDGLAGLSGAGRAPDRRASEVGR